MLSTSTLQSIGHRMARCSCQAVNGRNSNWQIPSWRWPWHIPSVPCWRLVVEQSLRAPQWRRRGGRGGVKAGESDRSR